MANPLIELLKAAAKKAKPIAPSFKRALETPIAKQGAKTTPEPIIPKKVIPEKKVANSPLKNVSKQPVAELATQPTGVPPLRDFHDKGVEDVKSNEFKQSDLTQNLDLTAKSLLTRGVEEFDTNMSHQTNFDAMTTGDDVVAVVANMAERNKSSIDKSRRGVVTDKQLAGLAQDIGAEPDFLRTVLERKDGVAFNAETVVAMRQMLNSSGERLKELSKSVVAGDATDLDKLKFAKQLEFHSEFTNGFMGARAETGRSLRAFGIKLEGDFDPSISADVLNSFHGRAIEDVAKVISESKDIKTLTNATRLYTQSKLSGVIREVYINSILSGVKTQLATLTGNSLMLSKSYADLAVAAQIGRFTKGDDKVLIDSATASLVGYTSAFSDALKVAKKAFKEGSQFDATGSKVDAKYPPAISSENLNIGGDMAKVAEYLGTVLPEWMPKFADDATNAIGTVVRLPTERAMTPIDEMTKTLARRGIAAKEAFTQATLARESGKLKTDEETIDFMAGIIENPSNELSKKMEAEALKISFQTPLGSIGRDAQSIVSKSLPLFIAAPFIKTPVNILKVAYAEMTPLGLFARSIREDIAAGGAKRDLALARMAIGTSVGTVASMWAMNGTITGGGGSNYDAQKVLRAAGWQPYSLVVTNPITGEKSYHSYQRLEPLSFIIGSIADYVELKQYKGFEDDAGNEDGFAYIAAVVGAIAQNTTSKTFTKGLSDLNAAITEPERYMKSYIDNLAVSMIPYSSLRRDLSKIEDPIMRQAYELQDKMRKSSGIVGWSDNMPPKRDLFGKLINHPSGDILGVLSLFPSKKVSLNPIRNEIVRVMKTAKRVPLTMPPRKSSGIKLSSKEYDSLTLLSRETVRDGNGRNFMASLAGLFDSDLYVDATDDGKVDLIKHTQRMFDRKAMLNLLQMPESEDLIIKIAAKQAFERAKRQGGGL